MMLPPDLRHLLDGSGLSWRIEEGGRHRKVIVGDLMISILPKSNSNLKNNGRGRTHRNSMAHIRQGIRKAKEQVR